MIHLSALPIGVLSHVSCFLAAPSRALFAATLFDNEKNDENRSKIAGNDWDTLGFGDIEAALAKKLSDDDINALLRCIDAVRKVKKLRLTNCMNISGTGLEPLRGSDVIERIDLRINAWDRRSEPAISCDDTLPLLESIIEDEGCSLLHLQLPRKWRKALGRAGSDFYHFLLQYKAFLEDPRWINPCFECFEEIEEDTIIVKWSESTTDHSHYGIQVNRCSKCFKSKHYCSECVDGDENEFKVCSECDEVYCSECSVVISCSYCGAAHCGSCIEPGGCQHRDYMGEVPC
ncbi:hypothetical protein ACHAWC_007342 [Mediolabrus comicus]